MHQPHTAQLISQAIGDLFRDAVRITLKNPRQALWVSQAMWHQKRAAAVREKWRSEGIEVPPFVIFSITRRCNLRCKGCYARSMHPMENRVPELSEDRLRSILDQIRELGISIVLLAGGEPLVRREVLELARDYPELIFPIFTNGLLITEETKDFFKRQPNLIPVISVEGNHLETDERRGEGVFETVLNRMHLLQAQNTIFGTSITVTRNNFATVTAETFIKSLIANGCKLFFFVEYIPVQQDTEEWVPTQSQREALVNLMESFRRKHPGLFIAFPGDEEKFGGCLAAGRGFVHINAQGGVEPCPFAPFSDRSLAELPLKEALQSKLLQAIRENADQLHETSGGCALWSKRDWVRSLVTDHENEDG